MFVIKKTNLNNCLGQSSVTSIFTLLIVVVLTILPIHFTLSQYSQIESDETLVVNEENLKVLEKKLGIEILVDEVLYFNSGESLEITSVKIGEVDCNINGVYSGVAKLNVKDCLDGVLDVSPKIVVDTSEGIFWDEAYLEKNLYGKFDIDKVK
jgi:hypothetical protein